MSAPVITATHTICDGLVIRWRRYTTALPILSASRNKVIIHGDVFVDDDLKQWIPDAEAAHLALQAGRLDEARALATHEHPRMFTDELVPVKPPPD